MEHPKEVRSRQQNHRHAKHEINLGTRTAHSGTIKKNYWQRALLGEKNRSHANQNIHGSALATGCHDSQNGLVAVKRSLGEKTECETRPASEIRGNQNLWRSF
jgi:hypothetical protein